MDTYLTSNVGEEHQKAMYHLEFSVTPIAKIKYWRSLVSSDIHLGDDVYFECEITANPATYNVTWRHNVRFRQLIIHTFTSFDLGQACR